MYKRNTIKKILYIKFYNMSRKLKPKNHMIFTRVKRFLITNMMQFVLNKYTDKVKTVNFMSLTFYCTLHFF